MRKHRCLKIRAALCLSDAELDTIGLTFLADGEPVTNKKQIRELLVEALDDGQEYIPDSGCDHFDPKIGCLGHSE